MESIKHYDIKEKLGCGGMGMVYRAFDTVLERDVAIKVMHQHLLESGQNAPRFLNEARAAARLAHPNIVTVYEVGEAACGPFIVMEYVDGTPVSTLPPNQESLPPDRAVRLTMQVLSGLQAAHKMKILHRDIKPDNILVTADGAVKILDFGIAKINAGAGMTAAGDVLGTVEYMAPEQMMGDVVDQRSDLYSVGVLLYQLLANCLPFSGETPVAILYKQLNEEPVPPSYYNSQIQPALDQLVLRAIAREADERWPQADDFLQALAQVDSGQVQPQAARIAGIDVPAEPESDEEIRLRDTFVGRQFEFRKLLRSYRKAVKGHGQTVVLRGEAGVGKSTLAARLQEHAVRNNALCLYGACLYQEGMDAYLPYIDALRKFFSTDIRKLPEEQRLNLKQVVREKVPLLMEFTERFNTTFAGNAAEAGKSSEASSSDLFEGIRVLISMLAEIQPVLFVLDDLQWADEASLRLFHYLARQIGKSRILLMATSRTDRFDLQTNGKPSVMVDVLSRMKREGIFEEIHIGRFSRDECDRLIDESLSNTIFSEDFYDKIFRETKGNAFFVLETLRYLQETEKIYFENGAWCEKQDELQQFRVPNRVEDVLVRRLNALTEEEREIIQVAAIIGYKFDATVLAKIVEKPKIQLLKMLKNIDRDLNVLIDTENGFQFEHPMLRDLLYEEVPAALRREYHKMIAAEMEQMYGPKYGALVGDIAEHFRHGGQFARAIPLLYKAATRAFKISAYREASVFYENLSDCLRRGELPYPEQVQRGDHLLKLAICYEETARWSESLRVYQQLLDHSTAAANPRGQVDALRRMGRVHEKLGDYDAALAHFENCLAILKTHPLKNTLSRIYNSMGVIYLQSGKLDEALAYFEKTDQAVDHEYGKFDRAHAITNIGIIHNIRGRHEEALAFYERALKIYTELADEKGKARVYHNLGMTYSDLGRWDESIQAFEQCRAKADALEDRQLRALALLNLGKACARQANWPPAGEYTKKALKIFRRAGDMLNIAESYHVLGIIHAGKRSFARAEKYFRDSIRINRQKEYTEGLAEVYRSYADMNHDLGKMDLAIENYEHSLATYKTMNLREKAEELAQLLLRLSSEKTGEVNVVNLASQTPPRGQKYGLHAVHN